MRTNLKDNETVLFITREHWYFLVVPLFISLIFMSLSIFLYFNTSIPSIPSSIIFILALLYIVYKIYERKYNIWVVTSLRLIDEEGVFSVKVKESPLDKINNVTYVQSFIGRFLGFGNVEIQTAAEQGATIYNGLQSPKELSEALTTAQENYKHNLFNVQFQNMSQSSQAEQQGETIECPYCAEIIKAKAKICRYCGRELHTQG